MWQELTRRHDYPVQAADWARLCTPCALSGPHDWGLAVGATHEHAGRKVRTTPLGELVLAFRHEGDRVALEALALLLARFMQHLRLQREFDLACKLPDDYLSGDGDGTSLLLSWPGVDYPLSVRTDLFSWSVAAGFPAVHSDRAMRLHGTVAGRSVLIVAAGYRFDPCSWAVHLLRAAGVTKVGVLALYADSEDLGDL